MFTTQMMSSMIDTPSSKAGSFHQTGTILVYLLFVTAAGWVYHMIAEGEFSSVLTICAIFQCLAFSLLGVQALSGNITCISAKSLTLDAIALICRLSCTTWLEGYIPNDSTGDYLYQVFDGLSLGMVLWLLYRVLKVQRDAYEEDLDTIPATPFVVVCFVLSGLLHADLNDRPLFDALWMCSLFIGAVAVIPQLFMMTHHRGSIHHLTSHFVAVMAVARALSGSYMWYGHSEITCEPWIEGFNHAGYAILAAHAVHLMLLGDFAYFYVKTIAKNGFQAPLEIPASFMV